MLCLSLLPHRCYVSGLHLTAFISAFPFPAHLHTAEHVPTYTYTENTSAHVSSSTPVYLWPRLSTSPRSSSLSYVLCAFLFFFFFVPYPSHPDVISLSLALALSLSLPSFPSSIHPPRLSLSLSSCGHYSSLSFLLAVLLPACACRFSFECGVALVGQPLALCFSCRRRSSCSSRLT